MKKLIRYMRVAGRKAATAATSTRAQACAISFGVLSAFGVAKADAPTDIDGVITWLTTNKTTVLGVGIALLAFAMGRKLLKKAT